MRISYAEFGHEYESYSFGYTVHGVKEENDDLSSLYAQGFLPYSTIDSDPNLFYMSRSVRVPVGAYIASSENRRILRKFDGQFTCRYLEGDALRASPSLRSLMLAYFAERHGPHIMPEERLEKILARDLPVRAAVYEMNDEPVAYVLEIAGADFIHYWYSCYGLEYMNTSLGMWLMLDAVRRAANEQRAHLYIGTAYGEKARYKTNIPTLQYWGGNIWSSDARKLQELMKRDEQNLTGNSA